MVAISGQSITLANSIIGVGILAMPFCFKECGIILAMIILIISGVISRLACYFLLKSAVLCRRRNFESLAFQVFGSTGKFAVEIGIIGFLMGTCIAYFVVVGDLGPQIIVKLFNLNHSDSLRTFVMICVSVVCVLPLGLLRNVDSLNNLCVITIGFYVCFVLKVMSEAISQIAAGEWINQVEYWRMDGVLQCMPIFSMALFCQTQLFEIYETLPSASLDKMNLITKSAINICTVVYILVGFFGYVAFYAKPISGNILVSFSPSLASDAIKMGFVMSLACSFPLIIFPCRASLYSLLFRKGQATYHEVVSNLIPESRFKWITISIIASSLITGLLIPNIELVLGFVGSTIGVMISVIFPATCFICISNKNTNERLLAQLILFSGVTVMVLGTYANLQAADNHNVDLVKYATHRNIPIAAEDKNTYLQGNEIVQNEEMFKNPIKMVEKEKMETEVIKESKVQPPIPVEPNERGEKETVEESKVQPIPQAHVEQPNKHDAVSKETKNMFVTTKNHDINMFDSNVKDVINQLEESPDLVSYDKLKENLLHNDLKINEKHLAEKAKELERISNVAKNDEAIENLKKDALMEQIKQHGKEQRELVEEQKEILKEIKKTKLEIESEKLKELKKKDNIIDSAKNVEVSIDTVDKLTLTDLKNQYNNVKRLEGEQVPFVPERSNAIVNEGKEFQKNPDILNKNQDKNNELIDTNPSKQQKEKHIHKEHEPKSYRLGEDLEQAVPIANISLVPSNKEAMVNNIPIPLAVALQRNELTMKSEEFNRKNIENLNNKDEVLVKKDKDTTLTKNNDHLGVQRDILDSNQINEEVIHIVNKRSVEKAVNENKPGLEECNNNILQSTAVNPVVDLLKSDSFKREIGDVNYKLDAIDLNNNIMIHQSRDLKSLKAGMNTR